MHLSSALLVLLVVLATARATVLLVDDEITAPLRAWVIRHRPMPTDGTEDKIVYFVHCGWCTSIWVGGGLAALAYFAPHLWVTQILLAGLTASLVAGLIVQGKGRL